MPRNNGVSWASAGGARPSVRPPNAAKPSPLARPETAPPVAKLQLPGPKPGETFRDCPTCPEMVVIPEGSFQMGSPAGKERAAPAPAPIAQLGTKPPAPAVDKPASAEYLGKVSLMDADGAFDEVAFSAGGDLVAARAYSERVSRKILGLWDTASGKLVSQRKPAFQNESLDVQFHPTESLLLFRASRTSFKVWDWRSNQEWNFDVRSKAESAYTTVTFHPAERRVLAATPEGIAIASWEKGTQVEIFRPKDASERIDHAHLSYDGKHIFAVDVSGRVSVWKWEDASLVVSFQVSVPYKTHRFSFYGEPKDELLCVLYAPRNDVLRSEYQVWDWKNQKHLDDRDRGNECRVDPGFPGKRWVDISGKDGLGFELRGLDDASPPLLTLGPVAPQGNTATYATLHRGGETFFMALRSSWESDSPELHRWKLQLR